MHPFETLILIIFALSGVVLYDLTQVGVLPMILNTQRAPEENELQHSWEIQEPSVEDVRRHKERTKSASSNFVEDFINLPMEKQSEWAHPTTILNTHNNELWKDYFGKLQNVLERIFAVYGVGQQQIADMAYLSLHSNFKSEARTEYNKYKERYLEERRHCNAASE